MCAVATVIDFGTDMIKLSAATLGELLEIQFEDLAAFVAQQSEVMNKVADVRDVAGLFALQRGYRDAFWKDRLNALVATRKTLQIAMERVGQSWGELKEENNSLTVAVLEEPKPRSTRTRAKTTAPRSKIPKKPRVRTKARAAKKGTTAD